MNNATGSVWVVITNLGVVQRQPDRLQSETRSAFVARTPEVLIHDLDGNLVRDGRWMYSWDAENRLTRVMSYGATDRGSWRRVEWECDAFGWRVRQTSYVSSNGVWQVVEDLTFVSDPEVFGRHVAELNATNNSPVRAYVWGLDLSETLDGAGGVGGMLWVRVAGGPAAGTHVVCYDGNGNVWNLASATSGTESARYEYAPFGEPLRLSGPAAKANPFRFSTKRTDNTTDVVLYEYRAYRPTLGRWLSRDPVSDVSFHAKGNIDPHGLMPQFEDVNAFSVVRNDPITAVDNLGLFCCRGVWYNPFTHCCRNGKVTKRGVVDTGYRKCSSPTQTQPKVDHVWLEWDGGSAGFYPNGATDGTLPGQVQSPDPASQRTGKKCDPIRLDPCHYDIDAFRSCLQQYINRTSMKPPIYHTFAIFGENCQTWSGGGVSGCAYEAWYDKHIQGI